MTAPMTLSAALRRGTRAAHDHLEQAPFFCGLDSGTVALDRFVGYLRALSAVHYALDREFARAECRHLTAVAGPSWLAALRHDISALGRGSSAFAVPAALAMTNDIRRRAKLRPVSLVGYRYVFEGSVMGLPQLRERVARTFEFDDCRHLQSLNIGRDQPERWKEFRHRLDTLDLDLEGRTAVVDGARAAFSYIRAIADDLQWVDEPPRLTAEAINPAAGVHPIIADPLVIEASIVAGDRVWDFWPYCVERFASRGLDYARSDSAWLALLADLPTPRASRQVDWLANVLAARGLPSAMLETHLEVVHDTVVEACPDQTARFAPLLDAAAELRAQRTAALPQRVALELLDQYRRWVGPAGDPLDLGFIGVEAVRDELSGRQNAVQSVADWVTAEQVGEHRATAFARTVSAARAAAETSTGVPA